MAPRTLNLPPEHSFRFPRPRRILRRIFRKSVLQALFLLFVSYVLMYALLSAGGEMRLVQDHVAWCPYGLRLDTLRNGKGQEIVRGSFFGYIFAPLIIADRMTIHRPFSLDSPEGQAFLQRAKQIEEQQFQYGKNR